MYDLDGHKLHLHPTRAKRVLNGEITPLTIELGLTSACNHNCTFCAFDFRTKATFLKWSVLERFIASLNSFDGPKSIHIAGDGEPGLSHHLGNVIESFEIHGYKVGITTNGTAGQAALLQSAQYLTWCRFSVNSGVESEYQETHGTKASLKSLFDFIGSMGMANNDLTIGVQCLMLCQNKVSLEKLYYRCADAEVDYLAFKPFSAHPEAKKVPLVHPVAKNSAEEVRDKHDDGKHTPRIYVRSLPSPKNYIGCLAAGTAFWLICANGEVYPCAQFVGKEDWCMGNIKWQTYSEIATSERIKQIIAKLRKLDCQYCRHPCRCDAANRYLHRLKNPRPHDAFL